MLESIKQYLPSSMQSDSIVLAMVGAVLVMVVLGIKALRPRDTMASRVRTIQERQRAIRSQATVARARKKPEASVNFIRAVVNRLQLLKNNQIDKTESMLIEGGFHSKDAIYVFAFFNLILPIIIGLIGFFFTKTFGAKPGSRYFLFNYVWPVLGLYLGFKLPIWYVKHARRKRYHAIRKALPDVLDLMTICAEAGLSLAASLERVSRELMMTYAEMAEELTMTSLEMGFLPDRNKALSNLAVRCKLPEVRGIVSVLIQTEKYGTPIAQALRVLSTEFRQTRMLNAEQKAARLPALMTVPMILFVLPTLFIVIIAPAAIKLIVTLNN